MKIGRYILVLLIAMLLIPAIACDSEEAEPTPTPTPTPTVEPTPSPVPILPDLAVTDLAFSPYAGCAGDTVLAAITIENQGTLSSPTCHWALVLYQGKESVGTLISLPPGASTTVQTAITLDNNITGSFNATATADSNSVVTEINESNNQLVLPFTISMCNSQAGYNTDKTAIQNAVTAYMAAHNSSLPLTNNSIALNYPSGTYAIIDICALVASGDLSVTPASCRDDSFDNCADGACGCMPNAHYIWLANGIGTVMSTCMGSICDTNFADGYQGVWP